MRPIDADALLEKAYIPNTKILNGWWHKETLEDVRNAPTIEPKCGRWIEDAVTYYTELKNRGLGVDEYAPYFVDDIACSCCMAKYSVIDNETQFFKFCPNCGAKMEKSDD